jgi:hypothetical protein
MEFLLMSACRWLGRHELLASRHASAVDNAGINGKSGHELQIIGNIYENSELLTNEN